MDMAAVKTDRMTFVRPYRIAPSNGYCVVWDALGQVVALGPEEMCERVVADLPIFSRPRDLFVDCSPFSG
jgi:hypothetical protein